MCEYVGGLDILSIMPGWGCCKCHIYNGLHRATCKNCDAAPCKPIVPTEPLVTCAMCGLPQRPCPMCGGHEYLTFPAPSQSASQTN